MNSAKERLTMKRLLWAGAVALLLVVSSLGPLPGWFASAAGGGLRRYLAWALVMALAFSVAAGTALKASSFGANTVTLPCSVVSRPAC